jgi:polysaccharide export outer membrane protein
MFTTFYKIGVAGFLLGLAGVSLVAQVNNTNGIPITPQQTGATQSITSQAGQQPPTPSPVTTPDQQLRPDYILGPNDQILLRAFEVDEINEKPFRVESDGSITLPLVGIVKASGLTVQQLENDLTTRFKTFVKDPHITISLIQFRSEIVFFVGAFQKPGIYALEGQRTLVEMLSRVGGLQPNASRRIKITRRTESGTIPLPNAVVDPENRNSTVEINMGSLRENVNPAEDIVLAPYDTISVERAELVYIQGEISHTAAFELGERESISVLQAVTLAGGLTRDANPSKAEILRPVLDTSRRAEIPINLKNILATTADDVPLMPNDVLYIPRRGSRAQMLGRAALIALPLASTIILLVLR